MAEVIGSTDQKHDLRWQEVHGEQFKELLIQRLFDDKDAFDLPYNLDFACRMVCQCFLSIFSLTNFSSRSVTR